MSIKYNTNRKEIKMINPSSAMKFMNSKNKFSENHPKFVAFLRNVFGSGVPEGTIIEVTVTKPGEKPVTSNIKVKQSDLDMLQSLRELT